MPSIAETSRILDRFERRFEREALRAFTIQFERALKEFEETGLIKPELIHETPIKNLIYLIYHTVGVKFGRDTFNEFKDRAKKGINETMDEIMDSWLRSDNSFIGPKRMTIWGSITTLSKNQFEKIVAARVAEGLENNWSRQRISRNLRKDIRQLNKFRARMIARTEVGKAQSVGHLKGIEATGLNYVKSWRTNIDDRERAWHAEADHTRNEDNEQIPKDQPFIVGGEKMQAPRIGGSARNVVNCRCQVLYEVVEEEELVDVAHT